MISIFASSIPVNLANAQAGKQIYHQGITNSATVAIGNSDDSRKNNLAPSTLFACSNCHGERAQGRKEAGLIAPDISWRRLSQGWRRDGGTVKPRIPYDLTSFKEALTRGIAADGHRLDGSMPRYVLDEAEIASLVHYLQRVEGNSTKGVTDSTINIGVIFPEHSELANALVETTNLYISRAINSGGIYSRKLRLLDAENSEEALFCVLDLRMRLDKKILTDSIYLSIFQTSEEQPDNYALYHHPLSVSRYTEGYITAAIVRRGWLPIIVESPSITDTGDRLKTLTDSELRTAALLHYSTSIPLGELINLLNHEGLNPHIVISKSALNETSFKTISRYPGRVYVADPAGMESVSKPGQSQLMELAENSEAATSFSQFLPMRLWTLSLFKLLTTSLQQSGRDLTLARFSDALQSQVDLQTDFGPALSYSRSRRVGSNLVILNRLH